MSCGNKKNGLTQWSSLQSDMLFQISSRLDIPTDVRHFRAVCSSWRSSSVPLPSNSPTMKLPIHGCPYLEIDTKSTIYKKYYDHLVLTEFTIYSLQTQNPNNTWMVEAIVLNSGNVVVKFPLDRPSFPQLEDETSLGSFSKLFNRNGFMDSISEIKFPKGLNLFDYKVSVIRKAYRFKCPTKGEFIQDFPYGYLILKVAASSSFCKAGDGFAVMIMTRWCDSYVWRVGDEKWTEIINPNRDNYDDDDDVKFQVCDIIFHNEKFYALDPTGWTTTIDPMSFQVTEAAPAIKPFPPDLNEVFPNMHSVESLDDLFLIEHVGCVCSFLDDGDEYFTRVHCQVHSTSKNDTKIYKLDKAKHEWTKIDRLEDRVLFIGDDVSFSCSAKHLHDDGAKGGCVCFKVKDIQEHFIGLHYLENGARVKLRDSQYYCNIFCPPTAWLSGLERF